MLFVFTVLISEIVVLKLAGFSLNVCPFLTGTHHIHPLCMLQLLIPIRFVFLDTIANTTVAKAGYPQMALGAAFGEPLGNHLLCIGVAMIVNTTRDGTFDMPHNGNILVCAGDLALHCPWALCFLRIARYNPKVVAWKMSVIKKCSPRRANFARWPEHVRTCPTLYNDPCSAS
jgi:Ca2+/Na+ antiporter